VHQAQPFHWTIPVEDPGGRDREWKVGARDGQVVILVPPGEGFTIKDYRYAAAAITAAGQRAEMQRTDSAR
jgi:hypothetical protein